ncbi:MAG: HD domain-containing protein [Calditrichaeota bacterium]|nr:HD domain-containing protein [Calditrichota bacterium]MCB9391419.1 HD domain-containing protein [Calditrichota bacterium]
MSVTLATTSPLRAVRELPANDLVQGIYLLTKIESRLKKNGEPFVQLEVQDYSGKLEGKMWDGFENALESLKPGDPVYLEGRVDRYRDVPGLVLTELRKATEQEVPDRRSFLPHSALSATKANDELMRLIGTVRESNLRALLEAIFDDLGLRKRFLEAPGGKAWHHATVGGLAEHTLSMTKLADMVAAHYPQIHRDLLITGTLLHDIGKVMEFTLEPAIDYTSEGRLIGHITQGAMLVEQTIREQLSGFPAELRKQLLHIILSHQGEPAMGSPIKPMTLEALALHYIDELDSRMSAFEQVRARTPEGQEFSDYQKLMERFFYFRSPEETGETNEP